MPVVLRYRGYRFFFFSNEGDPLEPPHVHVRKGAAVAKFWVTPEVRLAESFEISAAELRDLQRVIEDHRDLMERSWHEHLGG